MRSPARFAEPPHANPPRRRFAASTDVESFADALPQLLWIARTDGSVEFVNQAWCAFTGLRRDDLTGWRWIEALAPETRASALREWERVREHGRPARAEMRIRHADGRFHEVRGQHYPVRGKDGAISYWLGWCVDLEELHSAQDPLRTLADTLPALIFAAGDDDRLTYVNQAWREYTGLGVGTTLAERNALVHPDDLERLTEALRTRAPGIELRVRRKSDGAYRWFLLRWRRVFSATGTPLYRVATLVDVHDRHVAAEERERAATEERFLSDFSSSVNSTLDLNSVVRIVETLAVPTLADRCEVHLGDRGASALQSPLGGNDGRAIGVPLSVRGRLLGSLTLVRNGEREPFDRTRLELISEYARRAALAIDNALLFGREHRIASAMQSASLPKSLPKVPSMLIHATYVPGNAEAQIGGDWYDAFRLRDGRIVASVGDVTGSGIDAAVTMSNMRQIIRGTAQVHADPVLMLNAADRALRLEGGEQYVTAYVAVIDPIARSILYANAGHPPPYICRRGEPPHRLDFEDLPLGLRQKSSKRPKMADLPPDAMLFFYTDGLVESQRDLVGGIARLEALLASPELFDASDPAEFVCARMLSGGARDDVAVLTLRMRAHAQEPPGEATRHLYRWPVDDLNPDAAHDLRERLRRVLEEHGYDRVIVERGELVLGELIGNVVRHAPGCLEVIVDVSGPSPVLHVIDRGPGFERAPMLPADVMAESGRGLYIVSELTDEFSVSRSPGGGSHARAVLEP
jgi:PAS domain S-box-containing protein